MKSVTVRLPDALEEALADLARRRGTTRSSLIREAAGDYVRRQTTQAGISCLDLVRDLAGAFDGPADLSAHPRHLAGYGS